MPAGLRRRTRKDRSQSKSRLIEFGYGPGVPDGTLGAQTREAIRAFQRSSGMPVTGEITAAMITAMALGAD